MKKYCNVQTLILMLTSVLIIIMTGITIMNNSIWADEGFTIGLVNSSISELIQKTAEDVHPPLYYLIAKFIASIFGDSIQILKIVSFLPIIILFLIGSTKIQKEFGFLSALTFIMLVGFQPAMVYHVELRMYSWAMLFVTICVLFLYDILKTNRTSSWWGMIIAGLAAAYTHYYALITVAFLYLALFIIMVIRDKKNIKRCLLYSGITILGYIPWLFKLLAQFQSVSESYWIEELTLKDLEVYIWFVIGSERSMWILILFLIISTILFLFKNFKFHTIDNKKLIVIICFIGFLGNIILGIGVSFLIRPLFVARYIFVGNGLLWLGFSIAVVQIEKQKKILSVLLVCLLVVSGLSNYTNFYQKEVLLGKNTEITEEFIKEHILENDIIVSNKTHFTWTVLEVYFPDNAIYTYDEMEWVGNQEIVWIYSETKDLVIETQLEEANYKVEYMIEGQIDSDAYYLYRAEIKKQN